jgi:hypothetical protein
MTTLKGLLALAAAGAFLGASLILNRKPRTVSSVLLRAGFLCCAFVALDHVFEAFGMFPAFRWGQPHSIGHYLNLVAALLGVALLCAGFAVR